MMTVAAVVSSSELVMVMAVAVGSKELDALHCMIPHRAVTAGSRCHWYLLSRTPKHKSITVIDTYNTILQVGTQIDTLPEVMLTAAVMAWGNIWLLRWLYWILILI